MKLVKINSKYVLILLCVFIAGKRLFVDSPKAILSWDTFGYYLYLPATFIYHDPGLEKKDQWFDSLFQKYQPSATLYQAEKLENGKWFMRYSIGWATLNFPFFYGGHIAAQLFGYEPDGLSPPYVIAILLGGIFYTIIGLIFFRRFLLCYFSDEVVSVVMLLTVFGTNYLQLVTDAVALTHSYLFALYTVFFFYTYKWHFAPRKRYMAAVAVSLGLIAITRPNEALLVLVFIFWNVFSWNSAKKKMHLFLAKYLHIIIGVLVGLAVVFVQLFYWKSITGKWLFYSYKDPAVGFDFLTPYTLEFLFSFRKGWFIYTPLMVLSVAGLIFWYRKSRKNYLALWLFFVLNLYIISSWTCWWYAGGSYSSRSMMPSYVFLALGLGYVVQIIREQRLSVKVFSVTVISFLCFLNLFQYWQFNHGIISAEYMTFAYYKKVFLKTEIPAGSMDLLLPARSTESIDKIPTDKPFKSKVIYAFDAAGDTSKVQRLDSTAQFSAGPRISYGDLTKEDLIWLRAEAEIFVPADYEGPDPLLVISFDHKGKSYKYRTTESFSRIERGKVNTIVIEYQSPEVRSKKDELKCYVWHRGKAPVYLHALKVVGFE